MFDDHLTVQRAGNSVRNRTPVAFIRALLKTHQAYALRNHKASRLGNIILSRVQIRAKCRKESRIVFRLPHIAAQVRRTPKGRNVTISNAYGFQRVL